MAERNLRPSLFDIDRVALAHVLDREPRYRIGQVWDALHSIACAEEGRRTAGALRRRRRPNEDFLRSRRRSGPTERHIGAGTR